MQIMKNCVFGLLVLLAGSALAADVAGSADGPAREPRELDPVVVTGSRVQHASIDLPFSVDVIERSHITDAQPRVNLSEVLGAVPGVIVQNRHNYAQDLQVSSRGFGARSAFGIRGVKLIADGIPASMPDGQGQAATFNLDTADRIEVLRGPFSAMYGNHSGGVLQLYSREPAGKPSVEFGLHGGSYGTWKADLGAEGKEGNLSYLLDTSRFETNGYRGHSAAKRDQAYAKLGMQLDRHRKLSFIASALHQPESQDPLGLTWDEYRNDRSAASPAALAFNTRKSISHRQGGMTYEHRMGLAQLHATLYAGARRVVQYQAIPAAAQASPSSSGGVVDFDRRFSGGSFRWTDVRFIGEGMVTTTTGIDYERMDDARNGFENFAAGTQGVKGRLRRDEDDAVRSLGAYIQTELTTDSWNLHAGFRHSRTRFAVDDRFRSNGDDSGGTRYAHSSPAVGLAYKLSPSSTWYVSAAEGFETPTLNELFYSSSGPGFNFRLRPSISKHVEAGYKSILNDAARFNLALFGARTRDELVVDVARGGRTSYRNASRTERSGVEVGADLRLSSGFSARLAMTYLDAKFTAPLRTPIPGVPKVSLFADLAWKGASGLHAGVELIANGKISVDDRNAEPPAPGYAAVNLRLGAEQKAGAWRFREYVRINNAFDKEYVGSVIVNDGNRRYYEPAPVRNWMVGWSAQYVF